MAEKILIKCKGELREMHGNENMIKRKEDLLMMKLGRLHITWQMMNKFLRVKRRMKTKD